MRRHMLATAWVGMGFMMAAAVGLFAAGVYGQGPYAQRWVNTQDFASLEDVGEDVVFDAEGHVFSVGWVTNSATKTSYRLRVQDSDVNDGVQIATKYWPPAPMQGFHKAHAVALGLAVPTGGLGGESQIPIYITGESPNVGGQGLNIVTLRYILDYTPGIPGGTVTGPDVCTWNSDTLITGDDIGWDISLEGTNNTSGYVTVTGQSQGNGTGLDSITLGILAQTFPASPTWSSRYSQGGMAGRDDVTVSVARGPDFGNVGTVVVAGYSHGSSTDDFLVRTLDGVTGVAINDWRYDTGDNERATGVVAGDPASGVFATGWTDHVIGDGPQGPFVNKNYLTIRFNTGSPSYQWVVPYNGTAGKDDVAYSIAYAPARPNDIPARPAALFVGGASQGLVSPGGAESGYDYRVLRYDPDTGLIPGAWTLSYEAGRFNRTGGNSPDEAYAIGIDWFGQVLTTGRTKSASFDYGTVRFFRDNGFLDDGNGNGRFPPFFSGGSLDDQSHAVAVHHGSVDDPSPDVAVAGFVTDAAQLKNIRTIKYEVPD